MTYILTIVVTVVAFGLITLLAAQVELFRDMKQIRELTGMIDRPFPVDLGVMRWRSPAEAGLTSVAQNGVILILSDRCGTCRSLAAALDAMVPPHLQIVLTNPGGRPSELPTVWDLGSRAVEDVDGRIMAALDIKATPAAITVIDGVMTEAQSVPSARQLHELLDRRRAVRL